MRNIIINQNKRIGFCITCMNRLHHLKETLVKNMEDNYLPDDTEFVLLDYNSSDGLEEWVKQNLKKYIDIGMLIYYKTTTPNSYLRSHSRNMAFRLSDSRLVCNLDADNFLGNGFAAFMLQEFQNKDNIFYTSNYSCRDVIGRVCLEKSDFMKIGGYNEALVGYGVEDVELFDRLIKHGLEQCFFYRNEFYNALNHSNEERISQEYMIKLIDSIYLSYINPSYTYALLLYNNSHCEYGAIIDNFHLNHNRFDDIVLINNNCMDEKFRITIKDKWETGIWFDNPDELIVKIGEQTKFLKKTDTGLKDEEQPFYKIYDSELQIKIIMIIMEALNFKKVKEIVENNDIINENGFGKGIVYKNFNYSEQIFLK
ncbi:glycosyltransferase family 2 protein [Dysgonomonas sp. ZJ709]|uniref:glycosyltransferase n=1 Tax=Dysgonomonas sp. ZJ709 TaxID=2709797 RepID=UPI0013EE02FA|nr:galactosyltransferase-related protein [Dysgonomonas sp. ZJ709]